MYKNNASGCVWSMSTFVQNNNSSNNKCTQIFSAKDKDNFKQYGGGVQIIDGVITYTQNVNDGEIGVQVANKNEKSNFVQVLNGTNAIAFQSVNMNM